MRASGGAHDQQLDSCGEQRAQAAKLLRHHPIARGNLASPTQ
jgi:hypothetical protein